MMTRIAFIILFILLIVLGLFLIKYEVRGYALVILMLGSILTFLRRKNLGMKPWWGGNLRDIPKYFLEP